MTRHIWGRSLYGYRAAQQGLEQNMVRYNGESGSQKTRRNSKPAVSILFARCSYTYQVCRRDIKQVVEKEFETARRAKTDEECIVCIKNLRAETDSLLEQERLLRTKSAQLYAKVEFVKENNKIVGYMISAIHIVVSGIAIAGGALMVSTMTPLGMLAGAILVTDGINGLSKEIIPGIYGKQYKTEGFVADGTMEAAQFMGFKPETGLAIYNAITLTASVYSIFGLARRPEAWRLFKWMPRDFYRKVDTMSRPKLTMKIVGYGLKAKVIFDLLSSDTSNH